MRDLLKFLRNREDRIVKSRGENYRLAILGECHVFPYAPRSEWFLTKHRPEYFLDYKWLFTELKPQYFFCENVRTDEELDFARYPSMKIPEGLGEKVKEESFEGLLYTVKGRFALVYAGLAILYWFRESPSTIFVGMDLPGYMRTNKRIVKRGMKKVEKLYNYLNNVLTSHSDELTDEMHNLYQELREKLHWEAFLESLHGYDMADRLEEIREYIPAEILTKSKVNLDSKRLRQDTDRLSIDREKIMGKTIAEYTLNSNKLNVAVVGTHHIRKDSAIFPILDDNSIEYIVIDTTSDYEKYYHD